MARLKRYTLQELMDECDPSSPRSAEEQAWLDLIPIGLEIDGLDPVPDDVGLPAEMKRARTGTGAEYRKTPRPGARSAQVRRERTDHHHRKSRWRKHGNP